jgi:endopolyphosphatase
MSVSTSRSISLSPFFSLLTFEKFSFIRADDLEFTEKDGSGNEANVNSRALLDKLLLDDFAALPKNVDHSRYAIVNVSPSVVPNPYLPSFRIYSYNITQRAVMGDEEKRVKRSKSDTHDRPGRAAKAGECKRKKYKETWRCQFSKPWHIDPDAPSHKNVLWTPLGYAQVSGNKMKLE